MRQSASLAEHLQDYLVEYEAEPTLAAFHRSNAFVRGVRGPIGSGKSVATVVIEVLRRAQEQEPDRFKRRRTRWGIVRNTYAELRSTTIKTWVEWLPEEVARIVYGSPITCHYRTKLEDGTTLDMEVFFVSADRPKDVAKLKSMDLTGLVLNEASEQSKAILDMGTGRVGRFPPKKDGPLTWCGVIMDTNSMDDDHWYHDLDEGPDDQERAAEIEQLKDTLQKTLRSVGIDRPLMEFFTQPPALIEAQGSYIPNPDAENARNQPLGIGYWLQLIAGKSKEWIDIYVMNQYGRVIDGKPVYPEYNDEIHGLKVNLVPVPGLPLVIGLDFGLSPAALITQCTPRGKLLILGEVASEERSTGLENFLNAALKPYLANKFGAEDRNGVPWEFRFVGDPAGNQRQQGDERDMWTIAGQCGITMTAAKSNSFPARRESMAWFLNRLVEGQPAIAIDASCRWFRKGMKGGYHYRRIQVVGPEPRYQDTPFKGKYSHVSEAGQYAAMEFAAIEAVGYGNKMVPDWMRKLTSGGGAVASERPWKRRSYSSGRRAA